MDQRLTLTATAATHQVYDALLGVAGRRRPADAGSARDRGAVSLEQVLWFVAAGASVAVIATILWNTIRDEAQRPVTVPTSVAP
ncbi:MAG: hypothetical protein HKN41_10765 [Ilumatobacter sp.]|nr:hypothetical protein [Ilumatobacter sp.]